ncbi:uncharacterized protein LOC109598209 isoform X2 [Aethina tumida]|nr:uncharacterized protein LOC109598209 isoform X2 [Aethina tumida]
MVESAKTVDLVELKRLDSISWLDLSESNSTKSRSSTDLKDVVKTPDDLTPKEHVSPEEDRISLRGFLKDPNVIVTDLKKTIEGLQLRLTETIKQNNELKTQLSRRKDVSSDDSDRVIQKTDMELLKDMQDESTRKLEESFHGKLSLLEHNFQGQLDELKTTYETQIHRLSMDKEVGMKDKDQEISRLNDIIEKQCLRMSNEITSLRARMVESINANSNDDKIVFLQKCVAKMDRLFQKAERDYQKQIQKLKATLDQKEKSMQILLKSQRVEVMSKTCQEKQSQFDMVVNNLEVKYVKMLESQAQQYLEAKIKQDRMVEYLKQILDKHCIDYDLQNYD